MWFMLYSLAIISAGLVRMMQRMFHPTMATMSATMSSAPIRQGQSGDMSAPDNVSSLRSSALNMMSLKSTATGRATSSAILTMSR